jgi:hypothetical protein
MNNKDLLRQYVNIGLKLPLHQINKLPNNIKRSYFRARMINPEFYFNDEKEGMPEDMQIDAIKVMIKNGLKSGYIKPDIKFFQNVAEYLGQPSNYARVYNAMGGEKFKAFCFENGYKYWAKHLDRVDIKLRQLFTKEQFKEFSELYIKSAMARAYDISSEIDILRAGYATIQSYIDNMKDVGGLKGSKLDTEDNIFSMYRMARMLPTLIKFKEFNKALTGNDIAYILIYLNDKDDKAFLDKYFSNGGSMERINITIEKESVKNYLEPLLRGYQSN